MKSKVYIATVVVFALFFVFTFLLVMYPLGRIGIATDRHEPEITNGSTYFVCLFCTDYQVGDYVVVIKGEVRLLERVLQIDENSFIVTSASGTEVISTDNIEGRLFR